ncbi:hypothetical protein LEP1GSC052_0426 [Leptospira kmetyi serovar Malaysia str. Bejo-Iso9]|nr:hypothetical protein LEP1GSC052_0426 [Leptospira kmetyi serovar Malaysia str. Bejo-Iso9]
MKNTSERSGVGCRKVAGGTKKNAMKKFEKRIRTCKNSENKGESMSKNRTRLTEPSSVFRFYQGKNRTITYLCEPV